MLLHWLKSTFEKHIHGGLQWIRGYDNEPEAKDVEFDPFVVRKFLPLLLTVCENLKKMCVRNA